MADAEILLPLEPLLGTLVPELRALFPDAPLSVRIAGVEISETKARWVNDYAQSLSAKDKRAKEDAVYTERVVTLRGEKRNVLKVRELLMKLPHAIAITPRGKVAKDAAARPSRTKRRPA